MIHAEFILGYQASGYLWLFVAMEVLCAIWFENIMLITVFQYIFIYLVTIWKLHQDQIIY